MSDGIPYATRYTSVNVKFWSLADLAAINDAIGDVGVFPVPPTGIFAQMIDQGWSISGTKASTTMTLNVPLARTDTHTAFALMLSDFEGAVYRIYNVSLLERDPTGDIEGGLPVIGVPILNSMSDTDVINTLASVMQANQIFWNVTPFNVGGPLGLPQDLFIEARAYGPALNGRFMSGAILGGGFFLALPSGGGWGFTSVPVPGTGSTVSVIILPLPIINNLCVRSGFGDHEYLLNFKSNYISIVMPHQWLFFHIEDGIPYAPRSTEEVTNGGDNYWIGCPDVPAAQLADPLNPIHSCSLAWFTNRVNLFESFTCVTEINGVVSIGPLDAFEVDVGLSFMLLNSMYHSAGALLTTAHKSIQIASTLAVSQGVNVPLAIVGSMAGMYIETKYFPRDKRALTTDGSHELIAYRSQQGPCEATLWVAIS
jgi:hypothetical protein